MLESLKRALCRFFGLRDSASTTANRPAASAAAPPPSAIVGATTMNKITSIADVRRHFRNNKEPIYFISATNFNLLGIGDWVGNFRHINYINCFDGQQRNVFVPKEKFPRDFESIEDINNYLLEHKEVIDFIQSRSDGEHAGTAAFLMFDEHTEEVCKQLGLKGLSLSPARTITTSTPRRSRLRPRSRS
ncbi:MAG: hypothetical protein LC652_02950 [Halomonas sp.]|nr:hypothetical protein [Halomonas sp.]